jgi:hypothetical protein
MASLLETHKKLRPMFAGWFKIEGHSNPKPRRGFEQSAELLKSKSRLGGGASTSRAGWSNRPGRAEKHWAIAKAILFLAGLVCLAMLIRGFGRMGNGVPRQMDALQVEEPVSSIMLPATERSGSANVYYKQDNINL